MAVGAAVDDLRIDSLLWIFSMLITAINAVIIIAVIQEKKLRTYTNGFIVSLAISDALTGAVLFPVYILGPSNLIGYTNAIILFSGVANVCMLSYDRYVAVFRPFRYRAIISKSFKLMIISCWLFPVLIGLVPLAWEMAEKDLATRLSKGYMIILVLLVIFPHGCIFGAYCRIFVRLREKLKHNRYLKGKTKNQFEISSFTTQQNQHCKPESDGFEVLKGSRLERKYQKYRINARTYDIEQIIYENQTVLEGENERCSTAHMSGEENSVHENESSTAHDKEKISTAHEENSVNNDEAKSKTAHGKEKNSVAHERNHVPATKIERALRAVTLFSGRSRQSRAERRVAKILAVVVLIFFFSWSPVIFISLAYSVFNLGKAPTELVVFSAFTVAIGSLVNPALYAFLKPDLRQAIAKLFLRCPYTKRARNDAISYQLPNERAHKSIH